MQLPYPGLALDYHIEYTVYDIYNQMSQTSPCCMLIGVHVPNTELIREG